MARQRRMRWYRFVIASRARQSRISHVGDISQQTPKRLPLEGKVARQRRMRCNRFVIASRAKQSRIPHVGDISQQTPKRLFLEGKVARSAG